MRNNKPNEKRIEKEKEAIDALVAIMKSEEIKEIITIDKITEQATTVSIHIKHVPLIYKVIEPQQKLITSTMQQYCPEIKTMHIKVDNKSYYTWDYEQQLKDEKEE